MKRLCFVLLVMYSFAATGREKCVKNGCGTWSACQPGVQLISGEVVYGRYRDCCRDGAWITDAQECYRIWPGDDWKWSFDTGVNFGRESYAVSSARRPTDWTIATRGLELVARAPGFFFGSTHLTPLVFAEGGVATVHTTQDFGGQPRAIFDGKGTLWSLGGQVEVRPCILCPWSLTVGARDGNLVNADTYSDFGLSGRLRDVRFTEAGLAVHYSFLDGRFSSSLGSRTRRTQARIDFGPSPLVSPGPAVYPPLELDHSDTQLVAGVDVHLTHSLSGHIETSAGSDPQTAASLLYHFGSTPPLVDQRPRDQREEPAPQTTGAPEQDCSGGIPVCQNQYVQAQSYTGVGSTNEAVNTCLGGESNSVWYIFAAQNAGDLTFTINTTHDYDFALYNITNGGCAALGAPIRCNYSGTPGATGLVLPAQAETPAISVTAGGLKTMPGVTVTPGQTYALLVNNFTGDQTGYTLTFGGTASIFDTTPPSIASAAFDTTACAIEITMSEPILCSSIASNGSDFSLTAPSGVTLTGATGVGCGTFTKKIRLVYSQTGADSCGTWLLTTKVGDDGNTLVDNCHNALIPGAPLALQTPPPAVPVLSLGSNFCSGAPIFADGSATTGETAYFWSVVESDANWNVIGNECMQWFTGQAGTLDVLQFAQQHGCKIECNHYYRVKLAVKNCCTAWSETAKLIHVSCPPVADAGPDKTVCCCGPQKLRIGSPGVSGLQYQWTPTIGLDNPNASDPTIDLSAFADPSVPFPSVYEVTATDAFGCSAKDSVYIKTVCSCRPPATITVKRDGACSRNYTLTADCACGNSTGSYLWSPGGQTTQSIEVPAGSGPYTVTCRNECGATVSLPVSVPAVTLLEGAFPSFQCPSVFTPNGDGVNDLWVVNDPNLPAGATPAYNATGYELEVFDRWGALVADLSGSTSSGFANGSIPGWNGLATQSALYNWWQHLWGKKDSVAGLPVSEGTYYYIFKLSNCSTGLTTVCVGFTTVLR